MMGIQQRRLFFGSDPVPRLAAQIAALLDRLRDVDPLLDGWIAYDHENEEIVPCEGIVAVTRLLRMGKVTWDQGSPPIAATAHALTVSNGRWGHDDVALTFTCNVEPETGNRVHVTVAPACRVATPKFFARLFEQIAISAPAFQATR
jgi:hypothetical protein